MRTALIVPFHYAEPSIKSVGLTEHVPSDPGLGSVDIRRERTSQRGASRFSSVVSERPIEVGGFNGRFVIGKLGIAMVVVEVEIAELEDLTTTEHRLLVALDPEIAGLALESRASAGTSAAQVPPSALWVHRVLINTPLVERVVPLAYGKRCTLSRGAVCTIADGFSAVTDADDDHVAAVIDGLFAATQSWLAYDWLSRESLRLLSFSYAGDAASDKRSANAGTKSIDEPAALAFQARTLAAFFQRLDQGLVDGEEAVYNTAVSVWGLDSELDRLIDRADAYVEYIQARAADKRGQVDRRRNLLLFGLSFTALAQVVAAAFELLTGTTDKVGPSPRLGLFISLCALTATGLAIGVVYALVDLRRNR